MKENKIWKVDLNQLTPNQLAKYEDSIEVLNLLRHGTSIRKASQMVGISIPTIKKYVRPALRIKNNQFVARKNDSLLRKMTMYEDGRQVFIQIRGSKKASVIGKYHSAIAKLVDTHNPNNLKLFGKITIKDIKGKIHRFETNADKIFGILEKIEEPEFFTIYSR